MGGAWEWIKGQGWTPTSPQAAEDSQQATISTITTTVRGPVVSALARWGAVTWTLQRCVIIDAKRKQGRSR